MGYSPSSGHPTKPFNASIKCAPHQMEPETNRRWLTGFGIQPSVPESGASEPLRDVGASFHLFPQQAAAIVLDHQNDWPLIQSQVPIGDPALLPAIRSRKCGIEGRFKAIAILFNEAEFGQMAKGREHDLRNKR